MDDALT